MTSVLSFSWSRRTQRRYWFGKKSWRADKESGNNRTMDGWRMSRSGLVTFYPFTTYNEIRGDSM